MYKKIDFSKFSTIKIGPCTDVKIINENCYDNEFIIGGATNTLISPNPPKLGILDEKYDFIKIEKGVLISGAKTKNRTLYSFCKKHNIGGFEFLRSLPGSIGGSIKMNAGVKEEEISKKLIYIKTPKGVIEKEKINFSYRYSNIDSPVFEAAFEIDTPYSLQKDIFLKTLRNNQPKGPSLGSVFKNPKNDFAARLIDRCGLKGEKRGGVIISPVHANFFINTGGGSFEDMIYLINLAKKRVFETFGITLEEEIKIL